MAIVSEPFARRVWDNEGYVGSATVFYDDKNQPARQDRWMSGLFLHEEQYISEHFAAKDGVRLTSENYT